MKNIYASAKEHSLRVIYNILIANMLLESVGY